MYSCPECMCMHLQTRNICPFSSYDNLDLIKYNTKILVSYRFKYFYLMPLDYHSLLLSYID